MAIVIDTIASGASSSAGACGSIVVASGMSLLVIGANPYDLSDVVDDVDAITKLSSRTGGFHVLNAALWYQINPTAGTHHFSAGTAAALWAMTLTGTDTVTPFGTVVGADSGTAITVTSLSGGLVVDIRGDGFADPDRSPGASQTLIADVNGGTGATRALGSYEFAAGSVTMSWISDGTTTGLAVPINPAALLTSGDDDPGYALRQITQPYYVSPPSIVTVFS